MLNSNIQELIVSKTQLQIDTVMAQYDIWGSLAHACMLQKCCIIDAAKAAKIISALLELEKLAINGALKFDPGKGTQLSLEASVVELAGQEAGLSLHTARSRNDQVMTAETLYLREQVVLVAGEVKAVCAGFQALAARERQTPFPGYTHMQPAKPTRFSHWCMSYTDSLFSVGQALLQLLNRFDRSPLGAVESYGTSWPIDRSYSAKLLGFEEVWEMPLDAISQRGFLQLNFANLLQELTLLTGKIASDLMLYTTFEYGLVTLGDNVAQRLHPITGSSVMAQKRNPDALELIRGTGAQVSACTFAIAGVLQKLPSGYNRDSREVKEFIYIAIEKTLAALSSLKTVAASLEVNAARALEIVNSNFSITTDLADFLAQRFKIPYRQMYKVVGSAVDKAIQNNADMQYAISILPQEAQALGVKLEAGQAELKQAINIESALERRTHIGGTCLAETDRLLQARNNRLKDFEAQISKWSGRFEEAYKLTKSTAMGIVAGN